MTNKNISRYTENCFYLGLAIAFALWALLNDIYTDIITYYFNFVNATPSPNRAVEFSLVRAASIPGVIGLAILWLSAQLDFVDEQGQRLVSSYKQGIAYFVVGWASMIVMYAGEYAMNPSNGTSGLTNFIISALGLVAIIPYGLLYSWSFSIFCLGFFIGGILCLPRAVVFIATQHKAQAVWNEGKEASEFSGVGLAASLGQKSRSWTHARALRKAAEALRREAAERERAMKEEADRLSTSINDDTVRMEAEAEIAAKMAKIEELKIEIEEMAKFKRGDK